MSNNKYPKIVFQEVSEKDFPDLVILKNSLYPDHPDTIESMIHREKTRDPKILHKHWTYKNNDVIISHEH